MTILCSPSCDRWTERFVPVVPGVKSVFEREPTALELSRVERTMEILRNRYERWTRWHYARMLNEVRNAVLEMDHVPDDLEMALILRPFEEQQRSVLRRLYLQIYPEAASLVIPDDTLKSIRAGREVKELSLEQQRILQWIEETIGMSITDISRTTLDLIRDLWNQSTDTNDFYRRLRNDTHFTTSRAATIARTEAQCACTMSQYIMAGELSFGRPMEVTWHNSGLGEVRAWHKVMDGQSVPYNELFRVPKRKGGYDLMYCPGDRSHGASGENIINCRCFFTTTYLDRVPTLVYNRNPN